MSKNQKTVKKEAYDFHAFDICVENMADSPLATTNYFRSDRAQKGFLHLLKKCSNYHLLVPEMHEDKICEMMTGKYALISFGSTMTTIIFEDLSITPSFFHFDNQQIAGFFDDLQDKPRRKGFLAIYRQGKACVDNAVDKVVEVGRMDLWVSRTFETDPSKIRCLTIEESNKYKERK